MSENIYNSDSKKQSGEQTTASPENLIDVLQAAHDVQLPRGRVARYAESGATRLEASTDSKHSFARMKVERVSPDPTRFNFRFVALASGEGADTHVTASVWVGNKACQLTGVADRATGDINWTQAGITDTDERNPLKVDFSKPNWFLQPGGQADHYDIAFVRAGLNDSALGAKRREEMSDIQAAIDEVNYQLSEAAQDMAPVPEAA